MHASECMMIAVLKRLCKYYTGYINPRPRSPFIFKFKLQHDMLLYPSSSIPSNTTFRNIDGPMIYKTESLMRYCLSRQIAIKRMVPSNSIDLGKGNNNALRASFTDLAEIHYEFLSSRIRYNGTEIATSDFFRKSGLMGR